MNTLLESAISALLSLIKAGHALVLTASGGKDSTLTTLIGLEAIRRAKLEGVPQARHYVSSADTTIENPAMVNHLDIMHAEIRAFCAREELPVEIRIAQPTLAAQFVVSTIGRGTLVRTPENGVKDGVKKRPCSDAWKVQPQTKMAKELEAEVLAQGFKEPVVVLGSRRAESAARAESMVTHNASAIEATRNAVGSLTICPIGEFSTDDVWEALGDVQQPLGSGTVAVLHGRAFHHPHARSLSRWRRWAVRRPARRDRRQQVSLRQSFWVLFLLCFRR
jgi:DNA sulfur modification protein DndC